MRGSLITWMGLAISTASHVDAAAVTYPVPSVVPSRAAPLDRTPLGPSFEFFMWPSYMTNVTPVLQCLGQLTKVYKKTLPVRIGGTTQDRATYDPDFKGYVGYSVADPLDAPQTLTYGPAFFDLIHDFRLGFNRGDNNRTNTYEAVLKAKPKALKYLWGIELGNEPDFYLYQGKPVVVSPRNVTQEGADAASWAQGLIDVWEKPLPILAAGSYAGNTEYPLYPSTQYLISTAYSATIRAATKWYSGHLYASRKNLDTEMNHNQTVSDLAVFFNKISAANAVGRDFILGETDFHSEDLVIDSTFGAAISTLDRSLRALSMGMHRVFYHQGTVNQAYFNWWGTDVIHTPFYGAYLAVLAVAGGDQILESDTGNTSYAQYVIYKKGKPVKAVLINTDYFSGNGTRTASSFTMTGLRDGTVRAIRMTGSSSELRASVVHNQPSFLPTIGGQYFSDRDCALVGEPAAENARVSSGEVAFTLKASEAMLVSL
ncbi:hypothetical protein B0J14DRAFT_618426 [Halenospora varia]|nr:hypothetical protein B0J14DRAFT_618426 [Halenospora varia]